LQVLKIIRYTSKLLLATALKDSTSEFGARLKEFEASVGTSRCGGWPAACLHSPAGAPVGL